MVTTTGGLRSIFLAAMLVGAATSSAFGVDLDPLLGIYPNAPLQTSCDAPTSQPAGGISELNGINAFISATGDQIMIAGDFMDPEFPNPNFNVPADLGAILYCGRATGAWVNGYVPFVNLLYYGGGSGPGRSSTEIANGAADVKTRQWAAEFAKWSNGGQKRAFLAPLPEMNGNTPYHAGGPADFKLAYRRIRMIFEEELVKQGAPLTAISWVFAPNNGGVQVPQDNFENYYPGSDVVDIVGVSAYNQGGCAGDEPWFIWDTFDTAIKPYLDRLRAMAPNKPIFVAQTGTVARQAHGVGDKDVWLDDTFTKLAAYPGLKGVVYYNIVSQASTANCPNGFDFRLHDPNTGQWQGFPTGLGRPGVKYGQYALNSPELTDVVFGRAQQIFVDVLPNHPLLGSAGPPDLSSFIHTLYAAGITGGCNQNPLSYCPDGGVTRAQMAVFLLRGIHGNSYTPPPGTGTRFNDVPPSHPFVAWIEALADAGVTGGCGGGNFCPDSVVTRGQMAVFLLKAKFGPTHTPPAPTGVFGDVPISNNSFAPFIEELASLHITGGCAPGLYCPGNPVTRAQMAVFLVRTFNL